MEAGNGEDVFRKNSVSVVISWSSYSLQKCEAAQDLLS
jgi:hypothetical protein